MNTEKELVIPNNERVVTVVGGRGQLGRKIVRGFQSLKFGQVRICEEEDSFLSFVEQSTDIFFAVDDKKISDMLHSADELLTPQHAILDGSSVKEPLIPIFKRLDDRGINVVSTHLGAIPSHPWRGVKVWICEVGSNSERAKRLAIDLFISTNSSIEIIDITGKIVSSNINSNSINVSSLAKAVYTIRVKNKDVVLQKPLVIAE